MTYFADTYRLRDPFASERDLPSAAGDTLDILHDADAALADARDMLADVSARLDALAEAVNDDPAGYTHHHVTHARHLLALAAKVGDLAQQMKKEVFK